MLEMLEKIHELSIIMTFPKKLPDGWLLIRTNHNGAFVDGNLGVDTTFVPRKSDPNTQFIYDLRFGKFPRLRANLASRCVAEFLKRWCVDRRKASAITLCRIVNALRFLLIYLLHPWEMHEEWVE